MSWVRALAPWRELANRWGVYREVRLRALGRRFGPRDLVPEIDRIERRDRFAALWAIENLGYRYAESERRRGVDPRRLFAAERIGGVPERALPMLHAGVGLSLFRHGLGRARSHPPESADPSGGRPETPATKGNRRLPESADPFRERGAGHGAAAVATADLVRDISRPGHVTAAVECLGLITRFFHPRRVGEVADALAAGAPWASEPFWHGVGRCFYFLPTEMLPRRRHWWRLLRRVEREVPRGVARANAFAGLTWAMVLVNQRHPTVLEAFLHRLGGRLEAWGDDAGSGGDGNEATPRDAFDSAVASACAVRELTSPGHPVSERFLGHRPASPALAAAWRERVTIPGRRGIEELMPRLAAEGRVSDLCLYQPPSSPGERRSA